MPSPVTSFQLPAEITAGLIAHARAGFPDEVCGLLSGPPGRASALHRGRNISATPRDNYVLDPETLALQIRFEDEGVELTAIYHSHPIGPGVPSATDLDLAFYPDAVYLIVSLANPDDPVLRGFRIVDGRMAEVALVEG